VEPDFFLEKTRTKVQTKESNISVKGESVGHANLCFVVVFSMTTIASENI